VRWPREVVAPKLPAMPELPEVEHTRALLERALVGKRLQSITLADDPIVIEDPSRFAALTDRTVVAARRHGKVGWLELDRGPHLVFHLGMTGAWRVPGVEPIALESTPNEVDRTWPPRFAKIELVAGDLRVAMTDPRRFGRLWVRDDPRREAPIAELGFDALRELPPLDVLASALARRRGSLKGLLLDQAFVAGVGNWIADEVLFHARLDPRRAPNALDRDEVRALREALEVVVSTAVAADARKDRFPREWLFHRRWGKVAGQTTDDGHAIEHVVVAGRTTAWVPTLQR
jgi:formamidopyrimidine-DNA glycosylase